MRQGSLNIIIGYRLALTDYQLLGHNCVTTSVDPLFAEAQFDWIKDMSPAAQTLRHFFLRETVVRNGE